MTELPPLSSLIAWSHQLVAHVLAPGGTAIDLTAGNGHDTLLLARCVGPLGRVLAFDLQPEALRSTRERLREAGIPADCLEEADGVKALVGGGVRLIRGDHATWGSWCGGEGPRAIIANLGYLPGGKKEIVTRRETTLAALEEGFTRLAPGGRIVVVCYIGHPGGREEAEAVLSRFAALPTKPWGVMKLQGVNRVDCPILVAAERRPSS